MDAYIISKSKIKPCLNKYQHIGESSVFKTMKKNISEIELFCDRMCNKIPQTDHLEFK